MRVVSDLAELDELLNEAQHLAKISDDRLRALFDTFRMDMPRDHPKDPFSQEYKLYQDNLYTIVSGKKYRTSNEESVFDLDGAITRPFPYHTGNSSTVGEHLAALGFVLQRMDVKSGDRLLELGPGWGNSTLALAMMGCKVTAIDIESRFCEVVRARGLIHKCEIDSRVGDFLSIDSMKEQFDAVLFYECFHHCADHIGLLERLHAVIRPGGKVYLACEPITKDFPVPWGLRMDGQSLWAVRSNGWLELGYSEDYFREALERTGWRGRVARSRDVPWASLWVLTRSSETAATPEGRDKHLEDQVGRREYLAQTRKRWMRALRSLRRAR